LLTPNLLLRLTIDLSRSSLLNDTLLLAGLTWWHSKNLLLLRLSEYLLRPRLWLWALRLLTLLPSATAIAAIAVTAAASRRRAALMFLLSRRASAVRIAAAMPLSLRKNVLI
jgi:hypothetical protein